MDQMVNNTQWLFEHTPRALFTSPAGLTREQGVRIMAGKVAIPPRKSDSAQATIRFKHFFSNGSHPIITTGIISAHQRKIFVVTNGIGQMQPDHRGFQVLVNIAAERARRDKIAHTFFVAWQALGY